MKGEQKNRSTLRNFFLRGLIPRQEHFADLIESTVNILDDGLQKQDGGALAIQASQDDQQDAILLFQSFDDDQAHWRIRLNNGLQDASRRLGLNFTNGTGHSSLYIDRASGNVGINNASPTTELEVIGTMKAVGDLVVDNNDHIGTGIRLLGNEPGLLLGTNRAALGYVTDHGWGEDVAVGDIVLRADQDRNVFLSGGHQSTQLMVEGSTGNIGIGRDELRAKLDVEGKIMAKGLEIIVSPNNTLDLIPHLEELRVEILENTRRSQENEEDLQDRIRDLEADIQANRGLIEGLEQELAEQRTAEQTAIAAAARRANTALRTATNAVGRIQGVVSRRTSSLQTAQATVSTANQRVARATASNIQRQSAAADAELAINRSRTLLSNAERRIEEMNEFIAPRIRAIERAESEVRRLEGEVRGGNVFKVFALETARAQAAKIKRDLLPHIIKSKQGIAAQQIDIETARAQIRRSQKVIDAAAETQRALDSATVLQTRTVEARDSAQVAKTAADNGLVAANAAKRQVEIAVGNISTATTSGTAEAEAVKAEEEAGKAVEEARKLGV